MTNPPPKTVAQWAMIAVFRGYQRLLSPIMGGQCRFYPTCSHYAVEAVEKHGSFAGGWLALKRILRCHPFYRGDMIDPVPEKPSQLRGPTGNGDDLSL